MAECPLQEPSSRLETGFPRLSGSTLLGQTMVSLYSTLSPIPASGIPCWPRLRMVMLDCPAPSASFLHVNERDREWVSSKLTYEPNGTALQPIVLTGAREKVPSKTYIRACGHPNPLFDKTLAECKARSEERRVGKSVDPGGRRNS